jgi:MFS family permease
VASAFPGPQDENHGRARRSRSPASVAAGSMKEHRTGGGSQVLSGPIKRVAADLKTLPRQFWVLAGGIFVYLIGVEMTYPYETLYLNGRLGVSMTTLGVILGVTLLATLPLQVAGGALCDKVGRRPVLIVAILGSMTLYIGLGLTTDLAVIVALITFEAAFGWAQFITASNAMIADVTTMDQRTEAFGVSRTALNAGITIGPLLALPLLAADPSYRLNFFASGIVCGGFLLIVLVRLRETRPATVETVSVAASFRGYGAVLRDRTMLAFCLIVLLPLYAFGQIWATMPVMLSDLHDVTAQRWSVAMIVYGVAMVLLQYPVIRVLGDRDHMLLLSLSCVALGAGVGVAAFVPWPATLACIVSIAIGIVLLLPISSTVVSRLAPVELRGRYMGMWTIVYMGGYALGPLIGGWALDALGGRAAFVVIAIACLAGAALFPLLRRSVRARSDEAKALGAELLGERPEQVV